jgi:K+-sensing histidine kinase KdpD
LVLLYPAIMVSGWLGGRWPGIVATFMSAALADYFFLEPFFSLRVTHHGWS